MSVLTNKTNTNFFRNEANQAVMIFDLNDPLIAEMVEDILDVMEAVERKRNDTGVRISLADMEANFL